MTGACTIQFSESDNVIAEIVRKIWVFAQLVNKRTKLAESDWTRFPSGSPMRRPCQSATENNSTHMHNRKMLKTLVSVAICFWDGQTGGRTNNQVNEPTNYSTNKQPDRVAQHRTERNSTVRSPSVFLLRHYLITFPQGGVLLTGGFVWNRLLC